MKSNSMLRYDSCNTSMQNKVATSTASGSSVYDVPSVPSTSITGSSTSSDSIMAAAPTVDLATSMPKTTRVAINTGFSYQVTMALSELT